MGGMLLEYVFYPDVFFLTAFILNLLSLLLTGILGRRKGKIKRLAAAALAGSVWNLVIFLTPLLPPLLELFFTLFFAGSFMTSYAFSLKSLPEILRADGLLLLSVFLTGGIFLFLRESVALSEGETMAVLLLSSVGVLSFLKGVVKERARGRERYSVWLYYRDKKKEFTALADSGNRLVEPVTGKPVSVISAEDCLGFCDTLTSILYIPYRAVGTGRGMLAGTIFDKMEIFCDGAVYEIERPIVAICRERLSSGNDFSMLIPEEFIISEGTYSCRS